MNILGFFRDWLVNNEEKEKFRKSWINEKLSNFNWPEPVDRYHADMAYELYKLQERVGDLEKKPIGEKDGQIDQ